MKCLVLLLAVTFCQGDILKDTLRLPRIVVNQQDQIVQKPSQIEQDQLQYGPLIRSNKVHEQRIVSDAFQTPSQRQMYKSIVKTPFWHNSYENLVQTPWQRQMYKDVLQNDNFDYNWRGEITFPESDFLQKEFEKRLFQMVPTEDIPFTEFDLVEKIKADLSNNLPTYWTLARDSNSMALMITRMVMKDVLDKRMTCELVRTEWRNIFWTSLERIQSVHTTTETEMVEFLNTRLSLLLNIDQETIAQLTYWFTKNMEQTVVKDLSSYLVGVGIEEVAVASHRLYHSLKEYFEEVWTEKMWTREIPETTMPVLMNIIEEVVAECTRCPTIRDYKWIVKTVCWNLDTQFLNQEIDTIICKFEQFLNMIYNDQQSDFQRNLPRDFPHFPRDFHRYMTRENERAMAEILEKIRNYIRYNVEEYMVPLCRRNVYSPDYFQHQMFDDIVKDTQGLPRRMVDQQDQVVVEKRGQIHEELDQLHHVPSVKSNELYKQQTIANVIQTPWKRQMYKNILQQTPWQRQMYKNLVQTPFQLKTYKNFIQTPWQSPMNDVLGYNLRKEMTFPDSDFLLTEFEKRWPQTGQTAGIPFPDFDLVEKIKTDLAQYLPTYWTLARDPNTMAIMITRIVIKDVLDKRQTCNLVQIKGLDRLETILRRLQREQTTTGTEMVDFLENKLPFLVEVDQQTAMQLAYWFIKDMKLTVNKDLERYLVGVGIEDIAVASHKLYHTLKEYFEKVWTEEMWTREMPETSMSRLVYIIEDAVADCTRCPTLRGHNRKVKMVCWNLDTQFLQQETDKVVYRFKQMLDHFTYEVQQPMDFQKDFPRDLPRYLINENERTLDEIVEKIRSYIRNNVKESMVPLCRWNVYSPDYFQQQMLEPTLRINVNQQLPKRTLSR